MDRSTIETMAAFIPPSELGGIARDEEIWEEDDGGAHLKVTRHILPDLPVEIEVLSMSVTGRVAERRRVIGEFNEVFGEPASGDIKDDSEYVDVVMWIVSQPE